MIRHHLYWILLQVVIFMLSIYVRMFCINVQGEKLYERPTKSYVGYSVIMGVSDIYFQFTTCV